MGKGCFHEKRILGKKSESKDEKLDQSSPLAQPPKCPECMSQKVWKDGLRKIRNGYVQRYLCRRCGFRFSGFKQNRVPQLQIKKNIVLQSFKKLHSGPDFAQIPIGHSCSTTKKALNDSFFSICEDVSPHSDPTKSTVGKTIKAFPSTIVNAKVCVSKGEAKNLAEIESRTEKRAAGATNANEAETKGKIIKFLWELRKQGFKERSIETYHNYLLQLMKRGAELLDPESIKEVIAGQSWNENTKALAIASYSKFLEVNDGFWNPPRIKRTRKLPFVPLEAEFDHLISGANRKMATFLQLLKETGMRSGEAWRLKWMDIDFQNGIVVLNEPEKYGKPRMFKMSSKLMAMLGALPKKSEQAFEGKITSFRRVFGKFRSRMAFKLQNPRLKRISFHTFRHWKASTEYHKTKDILYVMELLGHRDIKTTLIYTQLMKFEGDEFHSATAKSVEDAEKLIEEGFEYVCTYDDVVLFRKRK